MPDCCQQYFAEPAGGRRPGSVALANDILGGDFTPLHEAEVEFTSVTLPDGRQVPFHTIETTGLNSIYSPEKAKRAAAAKQRKASTASTVKQQAKDQIKARINSQT